ncbi:MAG TPA: hypothetical protein VFD36_30970 [Kofleriaceae bacterium]|nr:hypothetical protein [Kofleriaceae bacterium]
MTAPHEVRVSSSLRAVVVGAQTAAPLAHVVGSLRPEAGFALVVICAPATPSAPSSSS